MSGEVLSRRDVHCAITDKIVAAVEAGAGDYCMPWHRSVTRPVKTPTVPTEEEIANRAYQLFVQRGCEHGRDWEDWLLAERELSSAVR